MKKLLFSLLTLILPVLLFAQQQVEHYPFDSATVEHPGIPKGEVIKFVFKSSKIFPGTVRDYWLYIPKQYDASKPACVYVAQDRIIHNTPVVFDNLINSHEMPVTIGVFVAPGQVLATDGKTALNRYNRSYEYDGLGDAYARFLLEELLPDVEKQKTSDGRPVRLSHLANDRAIGGSSSGAIAAFTAAWERPDAFSRVFTAVGTFVGLRGGDTYAALIRKYEAKPLRIYLQDGSNDQNIYAGDWFYANQMMERSLQFTGYQVNHWWGTGGHTGTHATAILPTVMRWLWKDYPQPVTTSPSKNAVLQALLIHGESWRTGEKPVKKVFAVFTKYENKFSVVNGKLYLSQPKTDSKIINTGFVAGGVALTPDQSQLYVTEPNSHWVHIFQVKRDGSLMFGQRYGWLYVPDAVDGSGAKGIVCDTAGRVYVATNLGVQILDQAGRVNAILPLPGNSKPSQVYFSGTNDNILYAVCGDKIYQRKLNTQGITGSGIIKPNKPKL